MLASALHIPPTLHPLHTPVPSYWCWVPLHPWGALGKGESTDGGDGAAAAVPPRRTGPM